MTQQAYRAHFRCFSGCSGTYPTTQPLYRCPTCDGLLEVHHDIDALRNRSAQEWRDLFDARYRGHEFPYGSGVWGKREWIAPEVPDDFIVSTYEGATNLFHARRLGAEIGIPELWVKQCGNAHTGSFKDLGMTVLVSIVRWAHHIGALKSPVIACASTGDTSASLAAYGAIAGLPVVVLLPRGLVSAAQLVQPLAHGATVLALETDFDGCMAVIRELASRGLIYLANSMNPLRIEGQKTVGIELTQQLEWSVPDWVILPSGNLGNAAALHAGFRMMVDLGLTDRMPRLCVAQAENANPMYRAFLANSETVSPIAAKKSHASAIQIGNPVSAPRAMAALRAMNGVVEQASEDELADACARADRTGLYTDPHTGVALACTFKLRDRGVLTANDRVVVVSTANALKFTEFKLGYHEKTLADVRPQRANLPITLPADVERIAKTIQELSAR
ncbi:threonine synthase [Pendulispora albinea]|uniref:Threonine synthase n=1 Tax=Pendulispora albinea TaxID=2741071 RepID=A0ABZ2LP82_9BACT